MPEYRRVKTKGGMLTTHPWESGKAWPCSENVGLAVFGVSLVHENGLYPPDWGGDGMGAKDGTDFGE